MTTPTPQQTAEAFSGHRFADAYDQLAADVVWVVVGDGEIVGRDAVIEACESLATELEGATVEPERFSVVPGAAAVAVDTVTRYTAPDSSTTVVASCDLYEFDGDLVVRITSANEELPTG